MERDWLFPLFTGIYIGVEIRTKINIVNDDGQPYMGPGPKRLLENIRELRSINRAAAAMNLSYVKALKLLNQLEKNSGQKIVIRRRGGNERGGAELTPYGEKFLAEYGKLEKRIRRINDEEFEKFRRKVAEG